jgi:hypothetical protein
VLSAEHPETWTAPQADPHDRIAFAATRATVRHVLVAGRPLVEDGCLLYLDLEEIYRESTRCLADLIRRSGVEICSLGFPTGVPEAGGADLLAAIFAAANGRPILLLERTHDSTALDSGGTYSGPHGGSRRGCARPKSAGMAE